MGQVSAAIDEFRAAVDAAARLVSAHVVGAAIGNAIGTAFYANKKTPEEIEAMTDAQRIAWVDAVYANPPVED